MSTIYTGATVIDGQSQEALKNHSVVVEKGKIKDIGPAEEFDENKHDIVNVVEETIMPGFINMHEHLVFKEAIGHPMDFLEENSQKDLFLFAIRTTLKLLARGFTTVRDMGTMHDIAIYIRDLVDGGELLGPQILTCNSPISCTKGHAHQISSEADSVESVRQTAREQMKLGADFVKVMASDDPVEMPGPEYTQPELTQEEIQAAVDAAHRWGKHATCHCMGTTALRSVIDAGIDIIDHGIYLNDELADQMASQDIFLTPTYSAYSQQTMNPVFERGESWSDAHRPLAKAQPESVRSAIDSGVKILNGTDSTGRYAEEIELLRNEGMDEMESLLTCGKYPAEALGLDSKIGILESGKFADFVVLNGDPLDDPYATEDIELVVKEGNYYRPESIILTPESSSSLYEWN